MYFGNSFNVFSCVLVLFSIDTIHTSLSYTQNHTTVLRGLVCVLCVRHSVPAQYIILECGYMEISTLTLSCYRPPLPLSSSTSSSTAASRSFLSSQRNSFAVALSFSTSTSLSFLAWCVFVVFGCSNSRLINEYIYFLPSRFFVEKFQSKLQRLRLDRMLNRIVETNILLF